MPNTVVSADIDETLEREASAVLASIGLTVSDAVRLMLTRTAKEKALPFKPPPPDAERTPEFNADRIFSVYRQYKLKAGDVLWADNFVAAGKRMRWDMDDLQRGLVHAFEQKWLAKAPEEDGGIRLTAAGFDEMQSRLPNADR